MKRIVLLILVCCLLFGCQKSSDHAVNNCRITRIVQGLNNDTVFLVNYDDKGRIAAINDSTHKGSWVVTYNADGKLVGYTNGHSDFSAVYNTDGMPVKITTVALGGPFLIFWGSQYVYEYNAAKQPVQKTTYTFNSGLWERRAVMKYEFSGADISRTYSYFTGNGNDSTKITVTDYNYYPVANTLADFSFFGADYAGTGLYNLLNIDFYFNEHLFKSSFINTTGLGETYAQQYIFDSSQVNIIKVLSQRLRGNVASDIYTRQFFYECK